MASQLILCKCGKAISVPAHHRGRKIRCRECGRVMRAGRAMGPLARTLIKPFVAVGASINGFVAWRRSRGHGGSGRTAHVRQAVAIPRRVDQILALLAWLYVVGIIVLTIMLWQYGDAWWPMTVVLFLGRWVVLVPLGVLVAVAAIRDRWLLVPLAFAGLIAVGPFMGFRTGWRRVFPDPDGTAVRVVTLNAGGNERVAYQIGALTEEWDADFIALQECGAAMRAAMHELTGWYFHEVRQICFMSRHPIVNAEVMDRSALAKVQESQEGGIGGSGDVARYSIRMPAGLVSVTNLHLETPRKGLSGLLNGTFAAWRLRANTILRDIESSLASRWVAVDSAPTIVAGDFNTPVESRIFRRHWASLTDAFSHAGFGFGMTKNNGWIRARIDHVLTGAGWHVKRVTMGGDLGSDHRPLIVDLTLVKPK